MTLDPKDSLYHILMPFVSQSPYLLKIHLYPCWTRDIQFIKRLKVNHAFNFLPEGIHIEAGMPS